MKKISINLFAIAVILTILLSNAFPTSVLGQEKYSVKGEIIYWWPEGQILVWLLKKEERKINKELIPQTRSLKIELDTKEGENCYF